MKKILGLMAVAVLAVGGSFGFASADPTTEACDAPIDINCTKGEGDDAVHCDLFVEVAEAELSLCENAPSA